MTVENLLTMVNTIVARGSSVLPKSVTPSRIEENLQIVDLDVSDMESLDSIAKTQGVKRFVYPDFGKSSSMMYRETLLIGRQGIDFDFPDKTVAAAE